MNISTHLMIDAIIIFAALTITLVLRAKGNAARKEKESEWLPKKKHKNSKNLNYLKFGISLFIKALYLLGFFSLFIFLLYLYK